MKIKLSKNEVSAILKLLKEHNDTLLISNTSIEYLHFIDDLIKKFENS